MALAYKGLSLGELGHLEDAIKHFKKALDIDKDYVLENVGKKHPLVLVPVLDLFRVTQRSLYEYDFDVLATVLYFQTHRGTNNILVYLHL